MLLFVFQDDENNCSSHLPSHPAQRWIDTFKQRITLSGESNWTCSKTDTYWSPFKEVFITCTSFVDQNSLCTKKTSNTYLRICNVLAVIKGSVLFGSGQGCWCHGKCFCGIPWALGGYVWFLLCKSAFSELTSANGLYDTSWNTDKRKKVNK